MLPIYAPVLKELTYEQTVPLAHWIATELIQRG